ncbi:hypothetical protein CCACVL1_16080 [Corchorus capsularis]|uniref:Uncharacterized protein n=1 Tax=Corchorus capsularis TaxID=210143 RepID=A0A1R3HZ81_COCAP|nr:hypothetical protein CCACVL1_16080 [Corchorus capsularis]
MNVLRALLLARVKYFFAVRPYLFCVCPWTGLLILCLLQLSIYSQRMLRPYRSSLLKKDKNLVELMDENLPIYSKKEFKILQGSVEKFKRAKDDAEKQHGQLERKTVLEDKIVELKNCEALKDGILADTTGKRSNGAITKDVCRLHEYPVTSVYPNYLTCTQRHMNENTHGYGVNAIKEDQQWRAREIESPADPSPLSISPPSAPVPTMPPPVAVPNAQVPSNEEISVRSKENQLYRRPSSSMKERHHKVTFDFLAKLSASCEGKSRFEGMKRMETIYGPPLFPQRFAPPRKTCSEESQSDSLQKREEVKGVSSKTINDLELYELDLQDSFQFFFKEDDDEPCQVPVPALPKEVSKIVQDEPKAPQEDIKIDIPLLSPPRLSKPEDKPPDDEQLGNPELKDTSVRDFVDNQLLEHEDQDCFEINKFLEPKYYGEIKHEEWIPMDQFFLEDKKICQHEDTFQRREENNANQCRKHPLHQPLTATRMALSSLAIHGVPINKIGRQVSINSGLIRTAAPHARSVPASIAPPTHIAGPRPAISESSQAVTVPSPATSELPSVMHASARAT